MWEIEETPEFRKVFNKLSKPIIARFNSHVEKLQQNPFSIGKPLSYIWFRELKNEGWRLYYIVNEDKRKILLVQVSNKRDQQNIINLIKWDMYKFKDLIKEKAYIYNYILEVNMDKELQELQNENDELIARVCQELRNYAIKNGLTK